MLFEGFILNKQIFHVFFNEALIVALFLSLISRTRTGWSLCLFDLGLSVQFRRDVLELIELKRNLSICE